MDVYTRKVAQLHKGWKRILLTDDDDVDKKVIVTKKCNRGQA